MMTGLVVLRGVLVLRGVAAADVWRSRAVKTVKQVFVAAGASADETRALVSAVRQRAAAGTMLFLIDSKSTRARLAVLMPYVNDILSIDKHPVATVCEARSCRTPTTEAARVLGWLE